MIGYKRILLFIYIMLGPINWLPLVDPFMLNILKYALFIFLLLPILTRSRIHFRAPINSFWLLSLFLILLPSIILGSSKQIFSLIDYSFIFLSALYIFNENISRHEILRLVYFASFMFLIMFLLSVLFIIIGYDIEAPEPWSNSTFIQSGFGGYRTGWSNSLFLYVPILLYLLKSNYSFKNNTYIIFIILSILFLQFQSGGRAGLMFSILAIGLFYRKSFLPLSFITILLYLTFSLLGTEYLSEKFRLSGAQVENKQGSSDIDKISSGRLSGYTAAFSAISGSPIYGYGLGRSEEALELYGYGIEVHNTFLKRTLESGIFLLFYLVFFFSFLYFKLVKKLKYNLKRNWISIYEFRNSKNFLNVFFICAISISFLEPNYLIGSFQGELVFWFTLFSFEK